VAVKNPFTIIQVGANDGKYNDPIYDFVRDNQERTHIALIEPQEELIPYLNENYSYHHNADIYNKAVGTQKESFELYRIKKEYYHAIDVGYGDDWPDYRVPTGVTTSDKQQLVNWISENIQSDQHPNKIIEQYSVDVAQPSFILEKSEMDSICLLQVDTEGMDDEVVYSFLEDEIYPKIINIESKHLGGPDRKQYERTLRDNGYRIYNYTASETLCIKIVCLGATNQ
jgi:FkbM family methyltransferase